MLSGNGGNPLKSLRRAANIERVVLKSPQLFLSPDEFLGRKSNAIQPKFILARFIQKNWVNEVEKVLEQT